MNRLPGWLKQDLPGPLSRRTTQIIAEAGVNTVCQQALCPNISECFKNFQATFMILGKSCTRSCGFCNVEKSGTESGLDHNEPAAIVQAIKLLGIKYAVITSVTRDDLTDGGASQFVKLIRLIRALDKNIRVEVLIPDFQGNLNSLKDVVSAKPYVLGHNLEIVKRLYSAIRPEADYDRSLNLLKRAKELSGALVTKSSLMLGLGEKEEEVIAVLEDLRSVNCDIVTLGQYLSPSPGHYPVKEFVLPELFQRYQGIGMRLGFRKIFSSPRARSSYCAEKVSGELSYA